MRRKTNSEISPFFCFSSDALTYVNEVISRMLNANQNPESGRFWNPNSWVLSGHICVKDKYSEIQRIFDDYISKSDCVIFVIANRIGKYTIGEWNLCYQNKKDVHIFYLKEEGENIKRRISNKFKGSSKYVAFRPFVNAEDLYLQCVETILIPFLSKALYKYRRAAYRKNVSRSKLVEIETLSSEIVNLLKGLDSLQISQISSQFEAFKCEVASRIDSLDTYVHSPITSALLNTRKISFGQKHCTISKVNE